MLRSLQLQVLLLFLLASVPSTALADPPPWDPDVMSDGCSVPAFAVHVLPDLERVQQIVHDCCVAHDAAYYAGGPEEPQRSLADDTLKSCMLIKLDQEAPALRQWAFISWVAVRMGGGPHTCKPYRWGFGQDWVVENGTPVYRPKPCDETVGAKPRTSHQPSGEASPDQTP